MSASRFENLPVIAETRALSAQNRLTDFNSVARMGYIAIMLAFGGFGVWAATEIGRAHV